MTTKIDIDRLSDSIVKLDSLKSEWNNKEDRALLQEENCGPMISVMVETKEALSKLQSGFISLLTNTISYMEQRKVSVEAKDAEATSKISK